MPYMVKVATVSIRHEIRNMLHRYIGGILKGVADVKAITAEEALKENFDIYVVYTEGMIYDRLSRSIPIEKIIAVELYPMPEGIKKVLTIPEGSKVGVVAGHLWDSADVLKQLIECGARNYYFATGTLEILPHMNVDFIIVPEEIEPYIKNIKVKATPVVLPRSLNSKSISKIIQTVIKFRKNIPDSL